MCETPVLRHSLSMFALPGISYPAPRNIIINFKKSRIKERVACKLASDDQERSNNAVEVFVARLNISKELLAM